VYLQGHSVIVMDARLHVACQSLHAPTH